MNESCSPKGGRETWDGLKVGEVAGEGSQPLPHVCTAPASWGALSLLPDSLSVTIGVRHLAGTRKSGITQETEIVAELTAQVLDLVGRP